MGKALAIVIQFVSDEWSLEQRLVKLQLLTKSMSGEEIAHELISVLSVHYSIDSSQLLALHAQQSIYKLCGCLHAKDCVS